MWIKHSLFVCLAVQEQKFLSEDWLANRDRSGFDEANMSRRIWNTDCCLNVGLLVSSFRRLIIVFSVALIAGIGSCVVHVNHTHTYRYKSTKAIALRQIPGEHFYGLLRASAHTHTHTRLTCRSQCCVYRCSEQDCKAV